MKIAIILVLVAVVGIGAFFLPSYLARREQVDRTFSSFEALQASVDAGAGLLEYKHRLVEATSALERMKQLKPDFEKSPTGEALVSALRYYRNGPDYKDKKEVGHKELLLEFSEVELHPATKESVDFYKWAMTYKPLKDLDHSYSLEPWARGDSLASAHLARAEGLLNNAELFAGRKQSLKYDLPPKRNEGEWEKLLPLEHPSRKKEYEAKQDEKNRLASEEKRSAAARQAGTERKAAAEFAAHLATCPLHVEIVILGKTADLRAIADGKQAFYKSLWEGDTEIIHARERVELFGAVLQDSVAITVNGKPWTGRWIAQTAFDRTPSAVIVAPKGAAQK